MKNSKKNNLQSAGNFTIPNEQKVFGNLHLNGRSTVLHLQPKAELSPLDENSVINGELGDLRKVSCLQCVVGSTGGGFRGDAGQYHYADIFPHFVTIGDQHLKPDAHSIKAAHFTTNDVPLIFNDFGAFGHFTDSNSLVKSFVKENRPTHEIALGDSPEIFYFSGKDEVIAVDTPIGQFRVSHRPSYRTGGSNGSLVKNSMIVTLEYSEPVVLGVCIERLMSIHRFLSLMAGRKQSIESVSLELVGHSVSKPSLLELHWSFAPKRPKKDDNVPRIGDIPLDAVRRPEEFKVVLKNWLSREAEWRTARIRYAGCMGKGNSYSIDRIVAAANMFDILPQDAMPSASPLSDELIKAQKDCREILKRLAVGVERDSILGALGRMNQPSLTKKVLHRVDMVNVHLASQFPELASVATTAVKIRNFFVHGSSGGFDPEKLEPLLPFLTNTLEFIFAASDLINAGWDAPAWGKRHHSRGHNFISFRWGYENHLALLKKALS
ncbi:hypothetical protein SAMN04515617_11910 [Collimonas sp. OK242]|uniref:ApeA N-terminal domain 1-containing protein n=1 Tax=Collimonas sp. OK242 TaxID=1798195 RepID=UPI00089777A2|nr:HEPN domain-containing protein [Collimonas sp. OK242]SDY67570.1 hypothetical protein SAMN04515617_11910 [Collimonas sp. OK242]